MAIHLAQSRILKKNLWPGASQCRAGSIATLWIPDQTLTKMHYLLGVVVTTCNLATKPFD